MDFDEITKPPSFIDRTVTYVADTCAPLREASRQNNIGLWAYGRGSYPGAPIDPLVLPQLRNVGMWEVTSEQPWGLDWHRNEGIEFTCVSSGKVPFSCENEEFDLGAGAISITRPWQAHRVGRPNVASSTLTWFILDVEVRRPNQDWVWPSWLPIPAPDLQRLTELLSHNEVPVWHATKGLLSAVATLQRTLRDGASQPMARIATSISEIFIELGDLLEQQEPHLDPYLSSTERTVQLFLDRLPERIQEPWSVDQMAEECGLGRTQFVYYCRQMVNVTPAQYLMAARISRAQQLLLQTDAKILEIAQLCGFQSSQYFATVFRQNTGTTPGNLRKSAESTPAWFISNEDDDSLLLNKHP